MDYKKAIEILEIDKNLNENLTLDYLKKKYHKMALLNHPDKNGNTIESNEKFKKILEAYNYLREDINIINEINNEYYENKNDQYDNNINNTEYFSLLKIFMSSIFKNKNTNQIQINDIIESIVNGCKNISFKLFEKLNKESIADIYVFLSKYKNILHISPEIINNIKEIIKNKYSNDQVFILNPNINDLLENNIYKLKIDDQIYFVPLWHDEVYFEAPDGNEIIVRCIPELPDNMYIDENNNIIISLEIPFDFSLFREKTKVINIGKKTIELNYSELFIQQFQYYYFYNCGISKINEKDIYSIENRSNIIINISFTNHK
jgi:DnaJ-class molecular chaperone